jgi:maltose alpha-D-glucosyltransferase/alpha-amylase
MKLWRELVGETFLKSYVDNSRGESFLPEDDNSIKIWLNAFLLERALLELDLELSHEKGQSDIPIGEIMSIMKI